MNRFGSAIGVMLGLTWARCSTIQRWRSSCSELLQPLRPIAAGSNHNRWAAVFISSCPSAPRHLLGQAFFLVEITIGARRGIHGQHVLVLLRRHAQVVERDDAREARNIGRKRTHVVITTGHPHSNRQLGVVILDDHLPRTEQFELQAATESGLVDVRQQRVHFSLARQLLLEQRDVLLHLLALLLQQIEVGSLGYLLLVVGLERDLLAALRFELIVRIREPHEPQGHHHDDGQAQAQRIARHGRPARGIVGVQPAELIAEAAQRRAEIYLGKSVCLP